MIGCPFGLAPLLSASQRPVERWSQKALTIALEQKMNIVVEHQVAWSYMVAVMPTHTHALGCRTNQVIFWPTAGRVAPVPAIVSAAQTGFTREG